MDKDITNKVLHDFPVENQKEVISIINELYMRYSSLGMIMQTLRSLVFLSGGDILKLKSYLPPERYFEPRDIVCEAEDVAGNPDHWFALPFDQLESLSATEIKKLLQRQDQVNHIGDDEPF